MDNKKRTTKKTSGGGDTGTSGEDAVQEVRRSARLAEQPRPLYREYHSGDDDSSSTSSGDSPPKKKKKKQASKPPAPKPTPTATKSVGVSKHKTAAPVLVAKRESKQKGRQQNCKGFIIKATPVCNVSLSDSNSHEKPNNSKRAGTSSSSSSNGMKIPQIEKPIAESSKKAGTSSSSSSNGMKVPQVERPIAKSSKRAETSSASSSNGMKIPQIEKPIAESSKRAATSTPSSSNGMDSIENSSPNKKYKPTPYEFLDVACSSSGITAKQKEAARQFYSSRNIKSNTASAFILSESPTCSVDGGGSTREESNAGVDNTTVVFDQASDLSSGTVRMDATASSSTSEFSLGLGNDTGVVTTSRREEFDAVVGNATVVFEQESDLSSGVVPVEAAASTSTSESLFSCPEATCETGELGPPPTSADHQSSDDLKKKATK